MSYNCDKFKVKKIEGLRIPVYSLFKNQRKDWHPTRDDLGDGMAEFRICETFIRGKIESGPMETLAVTEFNCSGEGSGTAMRWVYEPALADSTGFLVASTVWEGGDSIQRLMVKDGVIEWTDIEI